MKVCEVFNVEVKGFGYYIVPVEGLGEMYKLGTCVVSPLTTVCKRNGKYTVEYVPFGPVPTVVIKEFDSYMKALEEDKRIGQLTIEEFNKEFAR